MKTKKAFTLIELLVVIAIIALLVSILMPALSRARELANQIKCGTQLNGIGKAIALYQNDFKEINPTVFISSDGGVVDNTYPFVYSYPSSGVRWRNLATPSGPNFLETYSRADGWQYPTVGGSIWLLIRFEDLIPNMFLCPSAEEGEEMDLQLAITGLPNWPGSDQTGIIEDWTNCIDFWTLRNWTYGYHDPYSALLDTTANSALVLMADKSPAYFKDDDPQPSENHNGLMNYDMVQSGIGSPNPCYKDPTKYPIGADWSDDNGKNVNPGNSTNHNTECQNVLYADMHVSKWDNPLAGFNKDNIYTTHGTPGGGYVISTLVDVTVQIGTWAGGGDNDNKDTKLIQ